MKYKPNYCPKCVDYKPPIQGSTLATCFRRNQTLFLFNYTDIKCKWFTPKEQAK